MNKQRVGAYWHRPFFDLRRDSTNPDESILPYFLSITHSNLIRIQYFFNG